MVDVHDKIAGFQLAQHLQVQSLIFGKAALQFVAVETLKNLVICIAGYSQIEINEAFIDGFDDGVKLHVRIQIVKDAVEALNLLGVIRKEEVLPALCSIPVQVFDQQIKIFIEAGLGASVVGNLLLNRNWLRVIGKQHNWVVGYIGSHLAGANKGAVAKNFSQVAFIQDGNGLGKLFGLLEASL